MTISPTSGRVHVNRSIQFTATVRNSTNTDVTWSVSGTGCSGAACGMISSTGLYTAPANVPSPAGVVITATSAADPSRSKTAAVTVLPAVVVTIASPYPTLATGWTLRINSTVQNADDSTLDWTLSGPDCTGPGCGTITSSGLYKAPSQVPSTPSVTITATSVEDPLTCGSATIVITPSDLSVEWAWMSGSQFVGANGEYGTQGAPAPANVPGAREGPISWSDPGGYLWLFGGRGLTSNAIDGFLNDLWRFDPATREWTWVSGSSSQDRYGTYGTKGSADPSNVPGARYDSVSWLDPSGNLWLFGGYGIFTNVGGWDLGNDLWRYDPVNRQWAWMAGSSAGEQAGVYGTKGVSDPSNVPGARRQAVSWLDPSGALWLFGGRGYGSASASTGMLNDLWKFDPSDRTWTWISGGDTVDQPGVFGTKGVADASNVPGARFGAASWTDLGGNLWLFGGSAPGYDHLNDLWKFVPAAREWTWVSGSDITGQAGVYGTKGLADPLNVPGGRTSALSFRDPGGRLWLFGGGGYDSTGDNTGLNDLWMYDPATGEWTWAGGSNLGLEKGAYGIKAEGNPANLPGARYRAASWVDAAGGIWLFGGWATDSFGNFKYMNDLWLGIR